MDWIDLAQDRDQCRILVNAVIQILVHNMLETISPTNNVLKNLANWFCTIIQGLGTSVVYETKHEATFVKI
jgi:hypothetical protein